MWCGGMVLGACLGVVGWVGQGGEREELTREFLVSELARRMPARGTLRLEYEISDPGLMPGKTHVFVDFASGAWTMIRPSPNSVVGREPDGTCFEGTPHAARTLWGVPFERRRVTYSGFDFFLDDYLPLVMLRGLLSMEQAFVRAERDGTGEVRVEFVLPRGSRAFRVEELPAAEIERWGGVEKIGRRVTLTITPEWNVVKYEGEGETPKVLVSSGCSKTGVQVLASSMSGDERLTRCEYDEVNAGVFSMEGARVLSEQLVPAPEARTPIPRQDDPEPTPIRAREGSAWGGVMRGSTLTITGAALVVIGLVAWYRTRQGGGR